MKKKFAKLGGIGLSATLAAAALVIAPAFSASAAIVPTVGSGQPVFLLSDEDGTQIPAGSVKGWNDSVLGSPEESDEDYNSKFVIPEGTGSVRTFIAPRGQEKNQVAWNASGPLGLTPGGILLPNLKPSGNTVAGQGTPTGSGGVATVGGDYSLGIAFIANNGNTVIEADYTYITVVANANPNLATWTFATPTPAVVETAPAITTQPANATVDAGQPATFTAAASGAPTPTVKWQSSTNNGTSWADVAGATSTTLTVANGVTGTQYRAVFTNSKGSATSNAATLTVTPAAPTAPTEPTGTDAGKVTITDPAAGVNTITVALGAGQASKTLTAWAWSTPTNLGSVTTDASGNAIVDISSLPAGAHTVGFTLPGDATFAIVGWGTFTKTANAGDPLTDTVDLKATVTASDLWSLNAEQTAVDFGNVARGGNSTKALGKVTVVDDRNELKGWNLKAENTAFTKGTDSIPASALEITPKPFNNGTLATGITAGTNGAAFATSAPLVSTGTAGALFDADLKFTAPSNANSGEYHSTLTLTLTSK
jgi:hypothetical protein